MNPKRRILCPNCGNGVAEATEHGWRCCRCWIGIETAAFLESVDAAHASHMDRLVAERDRYRAALEEIADGSRDCECFAGRDAAAALAGQAGEGKGIDAIVLRDDEEGVIDANG